MAKLNRRNRQLRLEALAKLNSKEKIHKTIECNKQEVETEHERTEAKEDMALAADTKPPNENQKAKKQATHYRPDSTPIWKIGVEAATFVVGILALGFYWGQLRAMVVANEINGKGLDVSTKSMALSQRAFVYMTGMTPKLFAEKTGKDIGTSFYPQWENTGNTPAMKFKQWDNSKIFDGDVPEDFNFEDQPENTHTYKTKTPTGQVETFLAPHAKTSGGPRFYSLEQINSANSGKTMIYFWGHAEYNDVFECPHRVEYCSQLASFDGKMLETAACKVHNCVDDDCESYKKPDSPICLK
jgi:hypothetical protein